MRTLAPSSIAWILNIVVAAVGFIASFHWQQHRHLIIIRFYLLYFAVVGSIQYYLYYYTSFYGRSYWILDEISDILLFWVSAEIVFVLLPSRFARIWVIGVSLLGTLIYGKAFGQQKLLMLSICLKIVVGVVLLVLIKSRVRWTREYKQATRGLVFLLFLNLIVSLVWNALGLSKGLVLAIQLASLPGLVLFSLAFDRVIVLKGSKRPMPW